jgi:hypothetical protein
LTGRRGGYDIAEHHSEAVLRRRSSAFLGLQMSIKQKIEDTLQRPKVNNRYPVFHIYRVARYFSTIYSRPFAYKYIKIQKRRSFSRCNYRQVFSNIGFVLSIISVLFYVLAILLPRQPQTSEYADELTSIGAAISHVFLDSPVGFIDEEVQRELIYRNTPVREIIVRAHQGDIKPSPILKVSNDGNGIGYILFATLAMIVYGSTLDSIVFLYLTAVAASAACLIARYRGYQRYFLVLYFFAATVSLPSLIRFIHQIPVGGIRYFSVFAILPAAHILFEFLSASEIHYKPKLRYLLLLAIQVFFLT